MKNFGGKFYLRKGGKSFIYKFIYGTCENSDNDDN